MDEYQKGGNHKKEMWKRTEQMKDLDVIIRRNSRKNKLGELTL